MTKKKKLNFCLKERRFLNDILKEAIISFSSPDSIDPWTAWEFPGQRVVTGSYNFLGRSNNRTRLFCALTWTGWFKSPAQFDISWHVLFLLRKNENQHINISYLKVGPTFLNCKIKLVFILNPPCMNPRASRN